jgi:hypothetical protein
MRFSRETKASFRRSTKFVGPPIASRAVVGFSRPGSAFHFPAGALTHLCEVKTPDDPLSALAGKQHRMNTWLECVRNPRTMNTSGKMREGEGSEASRDLAAGLRIRECALTKPRKQVAQNEHLRKTGPQGGHRRERLPTG